MRYLRVEIHNFQKYHRAKKAQNLSLAGRLAYARQTAMEMRFLSYTQCGYRLTHMAHLSYNRLWLLDFNNLYRMFSTPFMRCSNPKRA